MHISAFHFTIEWMGCTSYGLIALHHTISCSSGPGRQNRPFSDDDADDDVADGDDVNEDDVLKEV